MTYIKEIIREIAYMANELDTASENRMKVVASVFSNAAWSIAGITVHDDWEKLEVIDYMEIGEAIIAIRVNKKYVNNYKELSKWLREIEAQAKAQIKLAKYIWREEDTKMEYRKEKDIKWILELEEYANKLKETLSDNYTYALTEQYMSNLAWELISFSSWIDWETFNKEDRDYIKDMITIIEKNKQHITLYDELSKHLANLYLQLSAISIKE